MKSYSSLTEAAAAIRSGEVTSVQLVEKAISVADACDGRLGMFLKRFNNEALAAAAQSDAAVDSGVVVGPLHGIPLGVKDLITTREASSTAQSLVLDPAWSNGDAVAVQRLRSAGGIIMGKLTMTEYAIGTPDDQKPFPTPRNPWNADRWAGGSSSGSGSSVLTGAVLGALGTDSGGSIRIPAAFCGISGLMPTYGRVPKSGCVPLGYSLDHVGPMARSARDCALMLGVLAGYDETDPTSIDRPIDDYMAALSGSLTGLRIGVDRLDRIGTEDPALESVFAAAVQTLRQCGAQVVPVELPLYEEMAAANILIMTCEAFAYHRPDLQTRWHDYFRATRMTVGAGIYYTAADYVQAQRARRVGQRALAALYDDIDLIVTPTSATGAPSLNNLPSPAERLAQGTFGPMYTGYWNTMGNPVLSVPMGFTHDGLPLGLQIAGRPFDEATVLRAGEAFQRQTNWHQRAPDLTTDG